MRKKEIFKDIVYCLLIAMFGLIIFHSVIFGDNILMTTDDNIGEIAKRCHGMPGNFLHNRADSPLLGGGGRTAYINLTHLYYWLLSPIHCTNWIHYLDLTLGSLLFYCFLRRKSIAPMAACIGVLTVFWLGSNLTLTYAGHITKYGVLAVAPGTLLALTFMNKKRIVIPAVCFGALVGVMFCEQQDVALFFTFPLGVYYLFTVIRQHAHWPRIITASVLAGIVALLIAANSLFSGYASSIKDVAAIEESAQQKWEFSTQWSWPPEESIAFVAPGYTGWRSGEPDGPYWGRMGRSADWKTHRQGFMNFKLENTYIGFIPVLLALLAIKTLFPIQKSSSLDKKNERAEIVFWGVATLITLLLSFGKFFPLYRVIYMLPIVNSIRNPNKFLQIFQLCLGILTAFGLNELIHVFKCEQNQKMGKWFWFVVALTGWFGLWMVMRIASSSDVAALAAQGWGKMAEVIATNKTRAIVHAFVMLLLFTGVWWCIMRTSLGSKYKKLLAVLLVVACAGDAFFLSSHYIKTMPKSWIEPNAVTSSIEENLDEGRIALVQQDGFYNIWLTYLFPYQNIPSFNFTQMPRMAPAYKAFLEAFQRNPIRLWQLSGVTALLIPTQVYDQIQSQPGGADLLTPLMGFDVHPAGMDNNFIVTPAGLSQKGSQTLTKFDPKQSGRFHLIGATKRFVSDEAALAWMADANYAPFERVAVTSEDAPNLDHVGIEGTVQVKSYAPATVVFETGADVPTILRCADRFDEDWEAYVDNKPVPVLKIDYLMTGIPLPAGKHLVELMYRPSTFLLVLQIVGYALVGLISAIVVLTEHRKQRTRPGDGKPAGKCV